jgi:hypothetical protein
MQYGVVIDLPDFTSTLLAVKTEVPYNAWRTFKNVPSRVEQERFWCRDISRFDWLLLLRSTLRYDWLFGSLSVILQLLSALAQAPRATPSKTFASRDVKRECPKQHPKDGSTLKVLQFESK